MLHPQRHPGSWHLQGLQQSGLPYLRHRFRGRNKLLRELRQRSRRSPRNEPTGQTHLRHRRSAQTAFRRHHVATFRLAVRWFRHLSDLPLRTPRVVLATLRRHVAIHRLLGLSQGEGYWVAVLTQARASAAPPSPFALTVYFTILNS